MGSITHTIEGNPASFVSAGVADIQSLKCYFKPIQDLHGYNKPWPGGSGKNLLPTSASTTVTDVGIIFTVNSNGSIHASGTATVSTYLIIGTVTLPAGSYYVSGGVNGSSYINILGIVNSYGASASFTLEEETTISPRVYITKGQTIDNTFYPMIRSASISDATWEPYENICPIEGQNNLEIYKRGKNLAQISGYNARDTNSPDTHSDKTNSYGTSINTNNYFLPDTPLVITQSEASNSTLNSYKNGYVTIMIKNLQWGKRYDISFKVTNIISNPLNAELINLKLTNPKGNFFSVTEISDGVVIFKNVLWERYTEDSTNASYNRSSFSIRICGISFTLSEFMVTEVGQNDGIFEPHCGNIIPITFPGLGKNKLPLTSATTITSVGTGYDNTLSRTLTPGTIYQNVSVNNYWLGQSNSNYTNNVNNGEITYMCHDGAYGQGLCIEVLPSTQYIASIAENEKAEIRWSYFDIEGNCIGYDTIKKNKVITTPAQTKYALIVFTISSNDYKNQLITVTNAQVELGSAATTYEPYSSNNTVYGGYVDLITGNLFATHTKVNIPSNDIRGGTGGFITNTQYQGDTFTHRYFVIKELSNAPYGTLLGNYMVKGVCGSSAWKIGFDGTELIHYSISNETLQVTADTSAADRDIAVATWLNTYNPYIIYELQTPKIIGKLSPTQLQTLVGRNNIWSNTNDKVSVTYDIHETPQISNIKKKIIRNSPHVAASSGNIATFNTDMIAPIKSTKFYFNPIQEGSGDPSPQNVRNISGWTGFDIKQTGKNMIRTMDSITYKTGYNEYYWGVTSWDTKTEPNGTLFLPPGTYTVSIVNNINNVPEWRVKDRNNEYLAHQYGSLQQITFTNPEYQSLILYLNAQDIANGTADIQLEIGSSVTNYESYHGQTMTIDWTSNGTIYGGYVDLISGNLYKTWEKVYITERLSSWSSWGTKLKYNNTYMSNGAQTYQHGRRLAGTEVYSNILTPIGGKIDPQKVTETTEIRYYGVDSRYPQYFFMANPNELSDADWRTWLSETYPDAYIVYNLETPIYITTLTPQQLLTLRGTNNIWSNANGQTEIQYWTH